MGALVLRWAVLGVLPLPEQRVLFLAAVIGIFMAGGIIFGLWMWFFTKWQFSRAKGQLKVSAKV